MKGKKRGCPFVVEPAADPDRGESAAELMERAERETGRRVDEPGSPAIDVLFGAVVRAMGKAPAGCTAHDDGALGFYVRFQMSPEGRRKQEAEDTLVALLRMGMSPDAIHAMRKKS